MDMRPKRATTRRIKAPQAGLFDARLPSGTPAQLVWPIAAGRRFEDCTFAVIDFETTGVGYMDRVVEIGVVRFKGDGSAFDQWATLVNPGRDLGAARVHGVMSFQDVRHAPRFEDVAGDLVERLTGSVVVAHSLQFEQRFLRYEFEHLHLKLPENPSACTLRLGCSLGAQSRRLDQLCRQFGIPLQNAHSALADAWSTARLLSVYLMVLRAGGRGSLEAIGCNLPFASAEQWPQIPRSGLVFDRYMAEALPERERPVEQRSFLERVVGKIPAGSCEEEAEYLGLLDRVVADFELTVREADALDSYAGESALAHERRRELHVSYFASVAAAAWSDGIMTEDERAQIRTIGQLLGIDPGAVEDALSSPPT